jgi:Uma2 family endonuclease
MSIARDLLVTADELERLSDEGYRYELVAGRLEPMNPVGGGQGSATILLSSFMTVHVVLNGLGHSFGAETGFYLARNPDTVLAPDWAFIAANRLPHPVPRSFVEVVPDIVLETRSPNDSNRQVERKIALWVQADVKAALDLDPERRRLWIYRPDRVPEELGPNDVFVLEDLLPGFRFDLVQLFGVR